MPDNLLDTLVSLPAAVLGAVSGGAVLGPGSRRGLPPSQPEPRNWSDDLDRKRGRMPGDARGRVIPPADPDMDRKIERPWDPFAGPRTRGGA